MKTIAFLIISIILASSLAAFTASGQQSQVVFQQLRKIEGTAAGDNHGLSLAYAGDVDRDGSADILVGSPGASPGGRNGAGSVSLYSGRTYALLHQFEGQKAGDDFGVSLAGAGDVNLDGFPDLLVGADNADPGNITDAGAVYLYSGSDYTELNRFNGEAANDHFGFSLASIGDLNGDGRAEFAVGAIDSDPNAQRTNAGRVYVYDGNMTLRRKLDGQAAYDSFGISVAAAGDVNADSYPDLIVGADLADPGGRVNAGSAYIYSGFNLAILAQLNGEAAGDFFGTSVSGGWDVNGDGRSDVLVGAPATDPAGVMDAGSAYVFSGAGYAQLHRFDGESLGDDFGWSVASAGDLNSDGSSDVLVGSDLADPSGKIDAGRVLLYSGSDYTLMGQVEGEADGDNLGWSVAGGADTDGDGRPDLLMGAPFNSPGGRVEAGAAYLYKVLNRPIARFTFAPAKPAVGQPVSFDARSSSDPDGTIVTYFWGFGDGATATGAISSHSYSIPGNFSVSLTVTDNSGLTHIETQSVLVNSLNQAPNAIFAFTPTRPVAGSPVTFDASSSSDADGVIVLYTWDFSDSSPLVSETDPVTVHTYTSTGPFTVSLMIRDDDGEADSTSQSVPVVASNQLPTARFTFTPAVAVVGEAVTFNGSTSTDPDGTIVSYSWNLGDGSSRSGATVSYVYAAPSTTGYQVTLLVTDDSGADTATTQLVQVLPRLAISAASDTTGGIAPLSVIFNTQVSGGQGPYTYSWDFGDGQTSIDSSPAHAYNTEGSYRAKVTVTDSLGRTATDEKVITIVLAPPSRTGTALFDYSLYGLIGSSITIIALAALLLKSRRGQPQGTRA